MTWERSILKEYSSLPEWLHQTVRNVSDETFFIPIKPSKWSSAEIISHLRAWDMFLLEDRLPYIRKEARLDKLSVHIEDINSEAAKYARSGVSKEDLVEETITVRQEVVASLQEFTPEEWEYTFYIDNYPMCLTSYIKGLVEHDHHHKLQIEVFMSEMGLTTPYSSMIRNS